MLRQIDEKNNNNNIIIIVVACHLHHNYYCYRKIKSCNIVSLLFTHKTFYLVCKCFKYLFIEKGSVW